MDSINSVGSGHGAHVETGVQMQQQMQQQKMRQQLGVMQEQQQQQSWMAEQVKEARSIEYR
jgi:hypothetical protein